MRHKTESASLGSVHSHTQHASTGLTILVSLATVSLATVSLPWPNLGASRLMLWTDNTTMRSSTTVDIHLDGLTTKTLQRLVSQTNPTTLFLSRHAKSKLGHIVFPQTLEALALRPSAFRFPRKIFRDVADIERMPNLKTLLLYSSPDANSARRMGHIEHLTVFTPTAEFLSALDGRNIITLAFLDCTVPARTVHLALSKMPRLCTVDCNADVAKRARGMGRMFAVLDHPMWHLDGDFACAHRVMSLLA